MLLQGITYNTTMALVAAAIMLLIPLFMRSVQRNNSLAVSGWGYAFVFLGFFLGASGLHMMLTWPLEQIDEAFCCKVDNFTFGEPAAYYGLLTLLAGIAVLRVQAQVDAGTRKVDANDMFTLLRPMLIAAAIGGFGLILIGFGGMHFGMWRPPEIEPIARLLAGNLIEPIMVMVLYVGTGVTAVLAPFIKSSVWVARIFTLFTWGVGILWLFLSLTVFYSHIGFFPQPDGTYI